MSFLDLKPIGIEVNQRMDHETPEDLFHGSYTKIDRFNEDFLGEHTGDETGCVFLTSDKQVATDYAIQSFIRKYDLDWSYGSEELVREGLALEHEIPDDPEEYSEFVQELALKHSRVITAQIRDLDSPLIVDCKGGGIGNFWNECEWFYDAVSYCRDRYDHGKGTFMQFMMDNELYDIDDEGYDDGEYEYEFHTFDHIILKDIIDSVGDGSNKICDVYIIPRASQIWVKENNPVERELVW
jgi:hypothetical protein